MKKANVQWFKRSFLLLMSVVLLLSFSLTAAALEMDDDFEVDEIENPYTDVNEGMWSYEGILYCYDQGVMTGTSETTFAPEVVMTRAMVVTALYKLNNMPAVTYDAGFADVMKDSWYEDAVNWAAEKGLVNGVDTQNNFAPDRALRRDEFVTLLYRYEKTIHGDTTLGSLDVFLDGNTVVDWAKEGLRWGVYAGLLQGAPAEGGVVINPTGTADRQQAAVLMMRFMAFNI